MLVVSKFKLYLYISCILQVQFHVFQIFFPGKQLNSFELSFQEPALHLGSLTCEFTNVTVMGLGCGFWRVFLALVFWSELLNWIYCWLWGNYKWKILSYNFWFFMLFLPFLSPPPKYDQEPRSCYYLFFIFYFPFLQSLALISQNSASNCLLMCSALSITGVASFLHCSVCPAISSFGSVFICASLPVCKPPLRGHCFDLLVHCCNMR